MEKPMPEPTFTPEKTIPVELLCDVWIQTGVDENGEAVIERLTTNTPVLTETGAPAIDPKTKGPITTTETRMVPVSIAKKLLAEGKARRADPLPE
jgi:hypothetical protein